MSLKEYERKRDFTRTPEPKPEKPAYVQSQGGRFFIQRHNATRLHYDFRLEIDGTLKSWAIPKGPSLDPTVKHLAAMVEDHPLDYGDFEGNIPKGEYGGGSVMLWDRGTFELIGEESAAAQIARGDLKFRLHGEKLSGTWAIVHMRNRGKGNEWLIIKKKDEAAQEPWDIEAFAASVKTGMIANNPGLLANPASAAELGKPITALQNPFGAIGSPTANSPLFQGNIRARYEWNFMEYNMFAQVGAQYASSSFTQTGNNPSLSGGGAINTTLLRFQNPAYGLVDASVGVAKDQWTVQLYGENLADRNVSLFTSTSQFVVAETPNRPRVLSLQLGYKF